MSQVKTSLRSFVQMDRNLARILWRYNVILIIAMGILIFVIPFLKHSGEILVRSLFGVVVISAVFAAEFQKKIKWFLLILSLGVVIFLALGVVFPGRTQLNIVTYLLLTISLVVSTIALVVHVALAPTANRSMILCAINSYVLFGLTSSVLFIIIDLIYPESFANVRLVPGGLGGYIYYGFVTLTTLGYGDITPVTPQARSLASFVALGGQLYLVIIMAMIIGKFLQSKKE